MLLQTLLVLAFTGAINAQAWLGLTDGQAVYCTNMPGPIFRYVSGQNWVLGYPSSTIAYSWDVNYGSYVTVDCTGLAYPYNLDVRNVRGMVDNQNYICNSGTSGAGSGPGPLYRYNARLDVQVHR